MHVPTSPNRIVNASPPLAFNPQGWRASFGQVGRFARSHASLRHSLPALVLLRKPLFGLSNRRLISSFRAFFANFVGTEAHRRNMRWHFPPNPPFPTNPTGI